MGISFGVTIPRPERPLEDSLADVPRAFRAQARRGFAVLAGVSKQHYAEILKAVILSLESRQTPVEDLERSLGLSKNDVGSLLAAAMMTVPMLGAGSGTADEFVSAAVKLDIIPSEAVSNVVPFVETVVAERLQLKRAIRQASLPSQVLPFLSDVEIVVDLRVAFEGDAVVDGVPVAIFHIDTDAQDGEIWFQASKPQLERLKRDVEDALKRMEAAAGWARRETRS